MNRNYIKFLVIMLLTSVLAIAEVNPLSEYLANEDFDKGIEKFEKEKNIFKESVVDREAIVKEVKDAEARVKSVFTNVVTTAKIGNEWTAVIYYNDQKSSSQKRRVITGEIVQRVNGYVYRLIPYENGVRVKDLRTGNFYKLEIKGR